MEDVDDLVSSYIERGRCDGRKHGTTLGLQEGATLGRQAGGDLAEELGSMKGHILAWRHISGYKCIGEELTYYH